MIGVSACIIDFEVKCPKVCQENWKRSQKWFFLNFFVIGIFRNRWATVLCFKFWNCTSFSFFDSTRYEKWSTKLLVLILQSLCLNFSSSVTALQLIWNAGPCTFNYDPSKSWQKLRLLDRRLGLCYLVAVAGWFPLR